jgi:hypothetical protein
MQNRNQSKGGFFRWLARVVVRNAVRLTAAALVGTLFDPITGLSIALGVI